jgi:excisionase family DNA binding protein
MTADLMLTVNDVASRLHVSKMTVYRLVNERFELRAIRVGRSIRVYESSVSEYLAGAAIGDAS